MPPEIIDLEHIRLRRPTVADAEAIFEYGSDPEVARYADWPVRTTVEPLIDSLRQRAARWESGEEFNWVITLPATNVAIGGVSCRVVRHAGAPSFRAFYWGRDGGTQPLGWRHRTS